MFNYNHASMLFQFEWTIGGCCIWFLKYLLIFEVVYLPLFKLPGKYSTGQQHQESPSKWSWITCRLGSEFHFSFYLLLNEFPLLSVFQVNVGCLREQFITHNYNRIAVENIVRTPYVGSYSSSCCLLASCGVS